MSKKEQAALSGPSLLRIPLLLAGAGALAVCVALSLAMGSRSIPLPTVLDALFSDAHGRDAMLADVAKAVGVELPKQ
ncbi:hypothetical protein ACFT7S_18595 [Streptomyces sp. NPDC057136]|uniref:hypothetical protein n=1 Tax=Streptomyces sp. NPDC057136 TaxID=3346029 RepID=UPI003629050C